MLKVTFANNFTYENYTYLNMPKTKSSFSVLSLVRYRQNKTDVESAKTNFSECNNTGKFGGKHWIKDSVACEIEQKLVTPSGLKFPICNFHLYMMGFKKSNQFCDVISNPFGASLTCSNTNRCFWLITKVSKTF